MTSAHHFLCALPFFSDFLTFAFVFDFLLPAFAVGRGVGVSVATYTGCAPRIRVRPSFSVSVMMGLAAGRNLCSFEYLCNDIVNEYTILSKQEDVSMKRG